MGAPTQDELDSIVREIEAKGLKVIHADKQAHYGRMLTIVVDEGEPDHVTVFEVWPEGLFPDQIADKASEAREMVGPGFIFEIGDNPRREPWPLP